MKKQVQSKNTTVAPTTTMSSSNRKVEKQLREVLKERFGVSKSDFSCLLFMLKE